ncbi:hypothetical protein PYCCODRAFT_1437097 [Trametes coccinea BRFM310]|uniref:Uncharacterized protein n=1 Tax=Trametes coccinea (strain BRFM310) TaxID=1353009 RepID=A0A1Y2IJM5_TRAC3|nr:hypothetical protein PYCCODRAFT_1437097 [Trametes coccinea BRFM310]
MSEGVTPQSTAPHTPGTEPNSSSSTLVNSAFTPGCSPLTPIPPPMMSSPTAEPPSPFSASFDPNGTPAQTPDATQDGIATPLAISTLRGGAVGETGQDADALWTQRLSMSFGAIADQIAAASRALATVNVPASSAPAGEGAVARGGDAASLLADVRGEVAALGVRLEGIERAQEVLSAQLQAVQDRLAQLQSKQPGKEKQVQGGGGVEEVGLDGAKGEPENVFKSVTEIAIEELQKKVEGIIETIKLDQQRLYARLHNATVTLNKQPIKAPIGANGKVPPNFPNTKGEFEHLTKERYEALLKAYNVPLKGDTNAKREALREFIGLTPPV